MIELFQNLAEQSKLMVTTFIDTAMQCIEPLKWPQLISKFANAMPTQQLEDFVDFYFNMKLEQLQNGDNDNQRQKPIG